MASTEFDISESSITDEKDSIKKVYTEFNTVVENLKSLSSKTTKLKSSDYRSSFNTLSNIKSEVRSLGTNVGMLEFKLGLTDKLPFFNPFWGISGDEYGKLASIPDEGDPVNFYYDNIPAGFRVQGFTEAGDYYVITCYDHDKKSGKKQNSRVYFYDKYTGECAGYAILNNTDHVGGCTYDADHDILFVSGTRNIGAYDFSELMLGLQESQGTTPYIDFSRANSSNSNIYLGSIDIGIQPATIYYKDGVLSAYTFEEIDLGEAEYYSVNRFDQGEVETNFIATGSCPIMVQGVAETTYNGCDYKLFTKSYSSNRSGIYIYKDNGDGYYEFYGMYYMDHTGLEGIEVDENGIVTGIFEFGKQKSFKISMEDLLEESGDLDFFTEYGYTLTGLGGTIGGWFGF